MNNLKSAFEETSADRILSEIPDSPDHVFSKAFERKMLRLIKSGSAESRRPITAKRVLTYVAVAILAAVILALTACGALYIYENFIFTKGRQGTYTEISLSDLENAPKHIEDVYAMDIPDGFEKVYERSRERVKKISYMDYLYFKGDEYILFSQYTKHYYDVYIDTEKYQIEKVRVNDCEGYFVDWGDDNYLIAWDSDDYIFEISTSIGKDALIELAESVHKVE